MKYLFFLIALITNATAHSQCSEFDRLLREGDSYLKKTNYQEAINSYTTAIIACSGRAGEAKQRITRMVNEINKLKENAVAAEQKATVALYNLQRIAEQSAPIVLADIDRNIYRLEYDSTYKKCKTAVGLNARRPEVEKRIWEIAYFYTEADTAAAAVVFLELLDTTIKLSAETPGLQQKLREHLIQTVPNDYLKFLKERYYPKLIEVAGGPSWEMTFTFDPATFEERPDSTLVGISSFHIGQTEITYWQYNIFARAKKHHIKPPAWEFCGNNPAVLVNWYDAAFYCNWLSEQHGKDTVYKYSPIEGYYGTEIDLKIDTAANGYRLPTEAEWEFAAHGGNRSEGFEYIGGSVPDSVAWYNDNSKNRTHTVGELKKNELDLFDMSGNAWEWCEDLYKGGSIQVIRGGSWFDGFEDCRMADLKWHNADPELRQEIIGFRLVLVP